MEDERYHNFMRWLKWSYLKDKIEESPGHEWDEIFCYFTTDTLLKEEASKKAFQNFEKDQKKGTSQANPKEGVVSERFECEYSIAIQSPFPNQEKKM